MRTAAAVGLTFFLAGGLLAQHRGFIVGGSRPTYGSPSGFGNILFPGTGRPPNTPSNPFSISDPGFAGRLGATVGGFSYRGLYSHPGTGRGAYGYAPYMYPVFVGSYGYGYGYGYGSPYTTPPPDGMMPVYQTQPSPSVIINQNFVPDTARPVVRDYAAEASPSETVRVLQAPPRPPVPDPSESSVEPRLFLIAFKDHTIYAATAYWVEGETLHYITPQGIQNQASLDLIDRELSRRLNRERNVEFGLPSRQ